MIVTRPLAFEARMERQKMALERINATVDKSGAFDFVEQIGLSEQLHQTA
jgi:hypothetical protein